MGRSAAQTAKFDQRKSVYNNTWQVSLSSATFKDPLFCCTSLFCPCCVSFYLRKRALHNDMSRYVCCAGDCPCSGRMNEQSCPAFCLATEVFLCFPQSVASTRWMLQDEMRIANTQCDNCIIGTMIALQYLSCIFSCAACITGEDWLIELAQILDCIADCAYVSVCACMQTQHKNQISARDDQKVQVQAPQPFQAPGQQQIPMGNYPPQGGAPPPGYPMGPPGGAYPPPAAGYPGGPPPAGAYPPGAYPQGPPPAGAYPTPPGSYPPPGYPQAMHK